MMFTGTAASLSLLMRCFAREARSGSRAFSRAGARAICLWGCGRKQPATVHHHVFNRLADCSHKSQPARGLD